MRLRWRAAGRPPPALRPGVRPASIVMLRVMRAEMLHMLANMLLQKQRSLFLQFSGTFANTMWCCSARVLLVLPLP